ncbi:aminotransferase class V-fold PLP-dependent enzyme [Streptomyces europaeiscabiei]|uniref:aminotransferase class V-fold PLP-dependent enzyme n=1 Tax=Streptomyces europaeiscabiei TaxID=146819 RepID=UPI0038F61B60
MLPTTRPPQKFEAGTGHIADAVGLGAAVDYLQGNGLGAAHARKATLMAYTRRQLGPCTGIAAAGTHERRQRRST